MSAALALFITYSYSLFDFVSTRDNPICVAPALLLQPSNTYFDKLNFYISPPIIGRPSIQATDAHGDAAAAATVASLAAIAGKEKARGRCSTLSPRVLLDYVQASERVEPTTGTYRSTCTQYNMTNNN